MRCSITCCAPEPPLNWCNHQRAGLETRDANLPVVEERFSIAFPLNPTWEPDRRRSLQHRIPCRHCTSHPLARRHLSITDSRSGHRDVTAILPPGRSLPISGCQEPTGLSSPEFAALVGDGIDPIRRRTPPSSYGILPSFSFHQHGGEVIIQNVYRSLPKQTHNRPNRIRSIAVRRSGRSTPLLAAAPNDNTCALSFLLRTTDQAVFQARHGTDTLGHCNLFWLLQNSARHRGGLQACHDRPSTVFWAVALPHVVRHLPWNRRLRSSTTGHGNGNSPASGDADGYDLNNLVNELN